MKSSIYCLVWARDVLEEPLTIHRISEDRTKREKLIIRVLEGVWLVPPEEFMDRFPHMLSGGQRQSVATARTLILSPSMIIADEPVSGKVNRIKEVPIKGEVPSVANIPSGCRFHPRCLYAKPKCKEEELVFIEIEPSHIVACHYPFD